MEVFVKFKWENWLERNEMGSLIRVALCTYVQALNNLSTTLTNYNENVKYIYWTYCQVAYQGSIDSTRLTVVSVDSKFFS